jgi:hypothetical protein
MPGVVCRLVRDGIGTAVSLVGLLVVVGSLIWVWRLRPRVRTKFFLALCVGLDLTEIGQLIRPLGWLWAAFHLAVIVLVTAGGVLTYRSRRTK